MLRPVLGRLSKCVVGAVGGSGGGRLCTLGGRLSVAVLATSAPAGALPAAISDAKKDE